MKEIMGFGGKITRKQEQAIAALLSFPTIAEAAKAAGIAEVTVYRWAKLPHFEAAYREARSAVLKQSTRRLALLTGEAITTLRGVMNSADTPPAARVSAARVILEYAYQAVEVEDLSARLAEVERLLAREE